MNKPLLFFLLSAGLTVPALPVQKGPYTVRVLAPGVYGIEDANDSNPSGLVKDADGKTVLRNNSSDMYLVASADKALLIDLSNDVKWDSTAAESLRSIVAERAAGREVCVTVTHRHGDHLGMLWAFVDDPAVHFWIPEAEFKGMNIFPGERTEYFHENALFDLGGGFLIRTLEVPGHTDHSTVFFLEAKDLVFTGDAIGSGNGVWLFNYESFPAYRKGIDGLIACLENPANRINRGNLAIHGGHAWQRGALEKLTSQYIYDMRILIERIGQGTAESEAVNLPRSFLDTNFRFGAAVITWNKAAAARYAESVRVGDARDADVK